VDAVVLRVREPGVKLLERVAIQIGALESPFLVLLGLRVELFVGGRDWILCLERGLE
jgi:hypothetical protein